MLKFGNFFNKLITIKLNCNSNNLLMLFDKNYYLCFLLKTIKTTHGFSHC